MIHLNAANRDIGMKEVRVGSSRMRRDDAEGTRYLQGILDVRAGHETVENFVGP